jgi:ParB family chromosome partitioning protein
MMELRHVEVSKLKPWKGNPRRNQDAVAAVAESIATFGFNAPVLCDRRLNVIAGHTRLAAAKRLRIASVPVVVLSLTGRRMRAYAVADNKTAMLAKWDYSRLRKLLADIRSEVNLSCLGFADAEATALLSEELDFDWDAFDRDLMQLATPELALVPVKVPVEAKAGLIRRINAFVSAHGLASKDSAVTAGKVLMHLLENKP